MFTDTLQSYSGMNPDYIYKAIDHAECYAKGNVHTNAIKNFWSLFKRCVIGTHVSVEPIHLFRYLDAECSRFNNHKRDDSQRFIGVARHCRASA